MLAIFCAGPDILGGLICLVDERAVCDSRQVSLSASQEGLCALFRIGCTPHADLRWNLHDLMNVSGGSGAEHDPAHPQGWRTNEEMMNPDTVCNAPMLFAEQRIPFHVPGL